VVPVAQEASPVLFTGEVTASESQKFCFWLRNAGVRAGGGVGLSLMCVGNAVGEDSDAKLGRNFLLQQIGGAKTAVHNVPGCEKLSRTIRLLIYKEGLPHRVTGCQKLACNVSVANRTWIDIDQQPAGCSCRISIMLLDVCLRCGSFYPLSLSLYAFVR
jgi:hypothetical protein